jgi:hypothetical protein
VNVFLACFLACSFSKVTFNVANYSLRMYAMRRMLKRRPEVSSSPFPVPPLDLVVRMLENADQEYLIKVNDIVLGEIDRRIKINSTGQAT